MTEKPETPPLPETKFYGEWRWCPCGDKICRRVRPSKPGMFYAGSGFSLEEAKDMVVMAQYTEQADTDWIVIDGFGDDHQERFSPDGRFQWRPRSKEDAALPEPWRPGRAPRN